MSPKPSPITPTTPNYGAIPITTTTTTSTPTSVDSFITRAAHHTHTFISYRRPWSHLLSLSSLSLPSSYSDASSRLRRNLNYFRFNYSLIILVILFLSLLWHPVSMIVFLAVFVLWIFLFLFRDRPLEVFGTVVDDRLVILALAIVTVLGLVVTNVGLNVLVALAVGFAVVGLHAAFRSVDDLFLDEEEDVSDSGFSEGQPLRPAYARV